MIIKVLTGKGKISPCHPLAVAINERSLVCDAPVGAAEEKDGNQLLEDHPIGYVGTMTTERMIRFSLGQQDAEAR
jgi:hypothetical protein